MLPPTRHADGFCRAFRRDAGLDHKFYAVAPSGDAAEMQPNSPLWSSPRSRGPRPPWHAITERVARRQQGFRGVLRVGDRGSVHRGRSGDGGAVLGSAETRAPSHGWRRAPRKRHGVGRYRYRPPGRAAGIFAVGEGAVAAGRAMAAARTAGGRAAIIAEVLQMSRFRPAGFRNGADRMTARPAAR
jgi:hypothetical protein